MIGKLEINDKYSENVVITMCMGQMKRNEERGIVKDERQTRARELRGLVGPEVTIRSN